ncbi:DNA internalization-related competence protein ComEC/Rec2 [Enterococcus thailandicus]|uniref:DNA internalization-related competence protein ComEC/Rec2 n=1 Tax=Enterococcus thailandicus TaxID=417368 RepID=UPI0025430257|nr:DNA internalization-related competence protein ComEC/Rec2 [Enterococcus thailandicus]MDK4350864.1 DNA internalization-related competence protein ComEC/Rec2 [Enterococcus thailandicus]MDT2733482.1 DNA internalization-related competence protein ComEC/Rec2 [Enterococcus thailandicus]
MNTFSLKLCLVQNRLIFPALISGLISLSYYTESWQYRLIFASLFFWICLKEDRSILFLSLVGGALVFSSCLFSEKPAIQPKVSTSSSFMINTDTMRESGDFITLIGTLIDEKQQKIQLSYRVQSEEELIQIKNLRGTAFILWASGEFEEPEQARNPYNFDQTAYFKSQRIMGKFTIQKVKKIQEHHTWRNFLQRKRAAGIMHVKKHLPGKVGVYVNALLFGYKDATFTDSQEVYQDTGLLHLFSLSGLHIQVYLGWIYYVFRRLGGTVQENTGFLLIITLCYVVLSGGSVSILRASFLFLLRLVGKCFKLRLSAMDRFAVVMWLLLLLEPLTLYQTGGQLSLWFSFLFIILPLSERRQGIFQYFMKLAIFSIVMMPLIIWHFFQWPIFGMFLTLLFLPLFEYLLLPLVVSIFFLHNYLPSSLLFALNEGLGYLEQLTKQLTFGNLIVGRPDSLLFLLTMVYLLSLHTISFRKNDLFKRMILSFFVPFILCHGTKFDLTTSVTFIDVGQGDSILLKAPNGRENVLIDTGGKLSFNKEKWRERPKRAYSDYNLVPFLKGQGIRTIHRLILTHDDTDHVGELANLAKHFTIETIFIGKGSGKTKEVKNQLNQLKKQGTIVQEIGAGQEITGYFGLHVLAPLSQGKGENEDSVVLLAEVNQRKFLFLGDLDQTTEEKIAKRYPLLRADIVKLGHHGSKSSTSPLLMSQLQAKLAIISCGANNLYGHPHQEVLTSLTKQHIAYRRTDKEGMIRFLWKPFDVAEEIQTMEGW